MRNDKTGFRELRALREQNSDVKSEKSEAEKNYPEGCRKRRLSGVAVKYREKSGYRTEIRIIGNGYRGYIRLCGSNGGYIARTPLFSDISAADAEAEKLFDLLTGR